MRRGRQRHGDGRSAYTFDPAHPGQASGLDFEDDAPFTALACHTATTCVTADAIGEIKAGGTRHRLGYRGPLTALACPSASECVAVTPDGDAYTGTTT